MIMEQSALTPYREPQSAKAGGYVLAVAGALVAIGLMFHPLPAQGFEEKASVLRETPLWGAVHVAIAVGFVLCVLGGLLILMGGGGATSRWTSALFWGAFTVGMIYFSAVAMINGWVMHPLAEQATEEAALFDTMNRLIIGFGWLGNPLFLCGVTGLAWLEYRHSIIGLARGLAVFGVLVAVLSWGRGIGSATGLYFLEPLILANVALFMWLSYYGLRLSQAATTFTHSTDDFPMMTGGRS